MKGLEATIQWDDPKISGLKPELLGVGIFLGGETVQEMDSNGKIAIRRKAKKLMTWNYNLFRQVKDEMRVIPPIPQCAEILATFHNDIGHLDSFYARKFVRVRFWGSKVYRDVTKHVKACDGCKNARRLPTSHTSLRELVTRLFETFSADFSGPSKPSRKGKRFALIAVELITG